MKNAICLLHSLGIMPSYRGYRQIILALELLLSNEDLLCDTMDLYSKIAQLSNVTPGSVERNIRTLSERAWSINPELLRKIAGYPLDAKPTNAEFLSMLLNFIQRGGDFPWPTDYATPIHT